MIITRYSSGYIGCTMYSILNILTQLGFATTAVILGGQTLASVSSSHAVPLVAGIVIIRCMFLDTMYAWMVTFFIMCCLYGLGGKAGFDTSAQQSDILSFGSIVFGSFTGWAPVAADYNVRLPADTSALRVFILTMFGLYIPICFTFYPRRCVLSPWGGGGKFLLVARDRHTNPTDLLLTRRANNIPNTYSTALSIQALGRPLAVVPRFIWVIFSFIIYTVAGVAGREHFSVILSNFLSILSYWTAFFIVIIAEEHFIFRRPAGKLGGYNLANWDKPSKLPPGFAGVLAGCCGVVGAVVGMAQVWYTGPVSEKAGATYGADLGFELAAAFAGMTYPPLRWIEIKLTGR
ncbi:hypothetical protein EDD16DRAFT_1655977 [Pisolithus croceorrhizus]|nr:hypothetical protein EDD16DRAFT_1655977 [Pisolithus croceorrhizus]